MTNVRTFEREFARSSSREFARSRARARTPAPLTGRDAQRGTVGDRIADTMRGRVAPGALRGGAAPWEGAAFAANASRTRANAFGQKFGNEGLSSKFH
jgi:hypothetical protein